MAKLAEYNRKRDFAKTKEPAGKLGKARSTGLSYLIQKHDATRLHYDFRLEFDGVLLSWAVTKGPSVSPADKRLAVRTEDHPLSYGTFEGTIPEGEYGGGTVMLWDRGTWEPIGDVASGLKKGHLQFALHGERLHGVWDLIRMHGTEKRENWLLIKGQDEHSDAGGGAFLDKLASSIVSGRKMDEIAQGGTVWHSNKAAKLARAKPETVADVPKAKAASTKDKKGLDALEAKYKEVQLATLVDQPPQGARWVHEIKFDGYRLLGFMSAGAVRLRTRNGHDWTGKFPSIAAAMAKLPCKSAVLDMEAVVSEASGKTSFQALQAALGDGGDTGRIVGYVFDMLHVDGTDLSRNTLLERKAALAALMKKFKGKALVYSEHVDAQGDDMFAQSCKLGLEGIISKLADAPYRTGRQQGWLKSKCILRQEFVILGYSVARKGNRAIGAVYLGYYKDKKLSYAGKAGTGFTMQSAEDVAARLQKIAAKSPVLPRTAMSDVPAGEYHSIVWAKPELLCEVAFTEWTDDGHVRHPSFQGLREDKAATAVKKEDAMPVDSVAKPAKAKAASATAAKVIAKTKADSSGAPLVLHGVTITHPERVISEIGHVTKGELAQYYAEAAPFLLPGIAGRPLSLLRCPAGIGKACFYQRNPGQGLGKNIETYIFKHKGKTYEYLYIKDAKGLMELVQMGAIELHPWGATVKDIDHPDRMIFDLDPAEDVPFEAVKLGAMDLRARLRNAGLETFLKCTGGKGLHVVAPLAGKNTWAEVKQFANALADEMVADAPEAYVATMTKAKRTGKIFIDFFRNDYTATAVADYGVRARDGAPVAMPLEWRELKGLKAGSQFSIPDAMARLKKAKADPARYTSKQTLPRV